MSKTVIKIRRKSDGKILTDVINDACQVHNIYDGDELILSDNEWMVGYSECNGFFETSFIFSPNWFMASFGRSFFIDASSS